MSTKLVDERGLVTFEPPTDRHRDITQGGRMGFLGVNTWLDEDGYHVWIAHDCLGQRAITMLPWPTWQVDNAGHVEPSFDCKRCGTHSFFTITHKLADQ